MIRIISSGMVGYHKNGRVIRLTKKSEPISLDLNVEAELVEKGIAEYVDGMDISSLEGLNDMKFNELKRYGKSIGAKFEVGMGKEEYANVVWNVMNNNESESEKDDNEDNVFDDLGDSPVLE